MVSSGLASDSSSIRTNQTEHLGGQTRKSVKNGCPILGGAAHILARSGLISKNASKHRLQKPGGQC